MRLLRFARNDGICGILEFLTTCVIPRLDRGILSQRSPSQAGG
ncbi:hypothetical protein [Campylobacter sp.]|nr:hypothetical protein [Campylobacter sp.]